jgi:rhomboid family GlyGly-CTERM serine protease
MDLAVRRRIAAWWLPAVLVFTSGVFELFGDAGRSLLRFDRTAIAHAEVWRLLSGHFVHLGPSHYLLNATGLVLTWLLVGLHFTARQWLCVVVASAAGIDAGLWFLVPQLDWYVGMSGLLHGMLAAGVVNGFKTMPREASLIGIVLLLKITFEQLIGPLPGSEQSTGGDVVVDAHLYGALTGAAVAAVIMFRPSKRTNNGE